MTPRTPHRAISRRTILAGAVSAALAVPHVARAASRSIRFGHNNPAESQFARGAARFASAVAADPVLSGVIKIEIFGDAQLGDDISMMKGVKAGTLDGMIVGTSVLSNLVPELGIINAPYLFADAARARTVLDGPIGAELMNAAGGKGMPILALGENGVRHITSNVAVRTVADLKGLKIRVPQSAVMLDGFLALGAQASPLAFNLLRAALISGEFQAQENAVNVVETAKLYEVQKFLCLSGHIYDAGAFVASTDLLEDLTGPQRASLAAAARLGAAVTRQVSDAAGRDGIGRLKSLGMTVIDDVDILALRAASRPYLDGLGATFGAERVRGLLAAGA